MPAATLIFRFHNQSRYTAAALLAAVEIDHRLTDLRILVPSEISEDIVTGALQESEIVVIAQSVMSTQVQRVERETKSIRKTFGDRVVLIGGGPHASARPHDLLRMGFDYVVVGEGERVFPEMLYRLKTGKSPAGIRGVVSTERETFPLPRDLPRVDLDEYPPFAIGLNIVGPVEITRGCPFRCKYCSTPFLTGGVVRHRSVPVIRSWLERAVRERGFRRTWFLSPNALSYGGRGRRPNRAKIEKLLAEVTSIEGLEGVYFGSFPSEVRPEFVTEQILRMMREYVANQSLQIGLQSGSDRILQLCNRHHSVAQGVEAVRIALDCGFVPHVDVIFGLPGENIEDRLETLEVCNDLVNMGARIHAHVFMPLPGSPFENMPPGQLDEQTRRALGDLSRRGLLTGSWGNQESLARMLAERGGGSKG